MRRGHGVGKPMSSYRPCEMSLLRREFNGVSVAENANSIFELLDLERLFQNRDRAFGQDAIEHFAVGITRDDDDRALRLFFLDLIVNIVSRAVRQFQIEENQIELLFIERGA